MLNSGFITHGHFDVTSCENLLASCRKDADFSPVQIHAWQLQLAQYNRGLSARAWHSMTAWPVLLKPCASALTGAICRRGEGWICIYRQVHLFCSDVKPLMISESGLQVWTTFRFHWSCRLLLMCLSMWIISEEPYWWYNYSISNIHYHVWLQQTAQVSTDICLWLSLIFPFVLKSIVQIFKSGEKIVSYLTWLRGKNCFKSKLEHRSWSLKEYLPPPSADCRVHF